MKYAIPTLIGAKIQFGNTPFPQGSAWPVPEGLESLPEKYLKIVNGKLLEKTAEEKAFADLPDKYKKLVDGILVEMSDAEKAFVDLPDKYKKLVDGVLVEMSDAEKAFVDLPEKYKKLVDGILVEMTNAEKSSVDIYENVLEKYRKLVDGLWIEMSDAEKSSVDIYETIPEKYRKQVDGLWVEMTAEEKAAVDAQEEQVWQDSKSIMLKQIENIYVDFLTNMWTNILRDKAIIASDYTITVENTDSTQNIMYLMALRSLDFDTYSLMAGEFERLKNTIVAMGGIMAKVQYHNI